MDAIIFNGYEYNEFGVCLNPDIPYTFGVYNKSHFEIKVSELQGGWTYGWYYSYDLTGGCGGCSFSGKKFTTRSLAIIACAEKLKVEFGRAKSNSAALAELDRIIEAESTPKPQVKQLTIFDVLCPTT